MARRVPARKINPDRHPAPWNVKFASARLIEDDERKLEIISRMEQVFSHMVSKNQTMRTYNSFDHYKDVLCLASFSDYFYYKAMRRWGEKIPLADERVREINLLEEIDTNFRNASDQQSIMEVFRSYKYLTGECERIILKYFMRRQMRMYPTPSAPPMETERQRGATLSFNRTARTIIKRAFMNEDIQVLNLQMSNIKRIEEEAFLNCSQLGEVNFNSSIEYIGPRAFRNTNLIEVNLPEETVVDPTAFDEDVDIIRVPSLRF